MNLPALLVALRGLTAIIETVAQTARRIIQKQLIRLNVNDVTTKAVENLFWK